MSEDSKKGIKTTNFDEASKKNAGQIPSNTSAKQIAANAQQSNKGAKN